jgi:hypothetical protein
MEYAFDSGLPGQIVQCIRVGLVVKSPDKSNHRNKSNEQQH